MILLAAVAIAASAPATAPSRPAGATVRATASVRILSSVTIRWDQPGADLPRIRQTKLRGANGQPQPLRLVEFE